MSSLKSQPQPDGPYLAQAQAAREIGVSHTWLCVRRDHPLFRPALRLGGTPRYHREQVRLWLAFAAGNITEQVAIAEMDLLRFSIGRSTPLARTDDHSDPLTPQTVAPRKRDLSRTEARHSPVGAGHSS